MLFFPSTTIHWNTNYHHNSNNNTHKKIEETKRKREINIATNKLGEKNYWQEYNGFPWFSCWAMFSWSCGEVCVSDSIVDYDYDIHKITPTATDLLFLHSFFFLCSRSIFVSKSRFDFLCSSVCLCSSIWAPNSMDFKRKKNINT